MLSTCWAECRPGTSATTTFELRLPGSRLLAAAGGARAVDRARAELQAVG